MDIGGSLRWSGAIGSAYRHDQLVPSQAQGKKERGYEEKQDKFSTRYKFAADYEQLHPEE